MKRVISLVLALAAVLSLAGCCLNHEWEEATCTEPRTCVKCGKTEGEPLSHDWEEATCTEPKTCSRCGETKGEPLGHDWEEATYDAPKTCSRCGETEGEPLEEEKYFDISFSEFMKRFNREYADADMSIEKREGKGFIMTVSGAELIVFNVDTHAQKPGVSTAYSTKENEKFDLLMIRLIDSSTNRSDPELLSAVAMIGCMAAQILDPGFDMDDYMENAFSANGRIVSFLNGITYIAEDSDGSVGSIKQRYYEFTIEI